jgi:hypothetical protein
MVQARWLVLGAGLLIPFTAQSQTIAGVVVEDGSRTPIAGAIVELRSPDARGAVTAQTDSLGEFQILARRAGIYTLHVTHPGYAGVDSDTLSVNAGETVTIELRMGVAAIPLEPLEVLGRADSRLAGFHQRSRRPGFGRFLTRADIEARPVSRATELLRGMPGVNIVPVRTGRSAPRTQLITMRGGAGECLPTIYVDGIVTHQHAESGVDDFVTPDMLEGVEVYTSAVGAPSPIVPLGSCGVVAFWTRSDGRGKWSWKKLVGGAGAFALLVLIFR